MPKNIKKRDGRTKTFDKKRIEKAVESACDEYYTNKQRPYLYLALESIYKHINELDDDPIDVETIQDIVVAELYKVDEGLADCYETYRIKRSI